MKSFDIFSNALGETQVVKQGFSWPGLFFSWIWGFVAKLWIHASVMLGAALVLAAIPGTSLIVGVFAGFMGNDWRRANLRTRGFNLIVTIEAESAEAALNKHVANKSSTPQESNDSSQGGQTD